MKKMTQNQLQLIVILLMVAMAAMAYRFGFMVFDAKASAIQAENNQLELRLSELEQKAAQKETYQKGLTEAQESLTAIYSQYGPGNTPQKSIMMIRDLEQTAGMKIENVGFSPETGIYYSTALKEDGTSAVSLSSSQLSIDFVTSYEGLKKCMDYINTYPERMNVESFNAVYDQETGLLKGAMIIDQYGLAREGSTYEEPAIGGIDIGTDNIFGTYTLPAEEGQ